VLDGVWVGVAGAVVVSVFPSGGASVLVVGGEEVAVSGVLVGVGVVVGAVGSPAAPVGLSEEVALGGAVVAVGVEPGDAGPVAGRGCGCGAVGRFPPGSWGSMKKPMPSPATARTEPAARCTVRARRRACTLARRRAPSSASKGVYSWESRIIRASSRSK
jgi:hypothetical protein